MDDQKVNNAPKQVFLLRHAENERGRGMEDPPLSEDGRNQAAEIGRYIAAQNPPQPLLIIHSGMQRALQTAQAIQSAFSGHNDAPVHITNANFILDDNDEGPRKALGVMSCFDEPGRAIANCPFSAPIGTCVWIGHRRNIFVDLLEIMFDPVGAVSRLSQKDLAREGVELSDLLERQDNPGFIDSVLGGSGEDPYQDYGVAHLSRWQLNSPLWDSYTGETAYAAKLAEVSFASLPEPQVVPVPG